MRIYLSRQTMIDIKNRWALITGASRGVGLRIATSLAEKGCRVILHSRDLSHTEILLNELNAAGHQVYEVDAELNSATDIEGLISQVNKITNNQLDILYNNAAIMTTYRPVFEPTIEDYQTSFMVNCIAPAKLCDAFLPAMLARNWGRIVNVSSGIINEPELMPYSCSKAALDRYVRDMLPTLEGTNVLMNLLDPGWLRTDLGGEKADNHPDSVIPGAIIPITLTQNSGSGKLYHAQDYVNA
jgi:short-subunit dehydrogenase